VAERHPNSLEDQSIMNVWHNVWETITPCMQTAWTPYIVLCSCPLEFGRRDLNVADVTRGTHLCNIRNLSVVEFTIHIALLVSFWMVNPPEIFQINKLPSLDVEGNITECGASNERIRDPFRTWSNVAFRPIVRRVIVPDENLVKMFLPHIFERGVHP
jgi:hypothetical protein